ncbi:hypothetical protein GGR56DRAFT_301276 [Xylariaceae sp. FL0804]|nr:hypothetical protein GGR56DRAFT_301276 [Xylariaceae sp. FL0804]
MAANMPQMGGGAALPGRPPNTQLSQLVYTQLVSKTLPQSGWQSQVAINLRVRDLMTVISNSFLAMPQIPSQNLIQHALNFEGEAFINSPDKMTYDHKMRTRIQELFRKRQSNEQNIQSTLNAQAQAQAQAQAAAQTQAQQLMMNHNMHQNMQMRGMGQPGQQGFQHLQQQMQPSPIPQQNHQPGMGMGNPGGLPMNSNQQNMPMGGPMRPQMPVHGAMASLSPQDRAKVAQMALAKFNQTSEPDRQQYRAMVQQKLTPQQMAQLQQEGQDPCLFLFQNQIIQRGQQAAGANRALQMQARQLSQSGQHPGAPNGGEYGPFANVESIMNQQKAGLMAQEAGQMVVPASNGPGRNATPQPMGGVPGPNQGPSQTPMSHQLSQQFSHQPSAQQMKMDHRAAQSQAQIRAQAQAKQMQGQPGGLNGAGAVSQSPAMNTLNAPVRRPPMGAGQVDPQMAQGGNGPFGQTFDPRFNQANVPQPMGGAAQANRQQQLVNHFLSQMRPESRQQFMSMPPDKINELVKQWSASQAGQMPARPQSQPGQFGQGNPMAQFAPGANAAGQPPNPGMPMNPQNQMMLQQQINRMRNNVSGQGQPQAPPNSNALMDQMDVPPKILEQIKVNQQIPADIQKWSQLKQWLSGKSQPQGFLSQLAGVQSVQFQSMLRKGNNPAFATPGQQSNMPQPGPQAAAGQMSQQPNMQMNAALASIHVSPEEIQSAKSHNKFKDWPENKIKMFLMQMKTHALKTRAAGQQPGGQVQISQTGQPPSTNAPVPAPAAVNGTNAAQRRAEASPASAAPPINNKPQSQNSRPTQSAPGAQQNKGVKRASTDDVVEVPNHTSTPMQRPPSQQQQQASGPAPAQQVPQLTAQQLASMNPHQRQKYEAMRARQAAAAGGHQPSALPEEMQRLRAIGQEQHQAAAHEQLPEIPMTPEQHQDVAQKIQAMVGEMTKLSKVLGRWYTLTNDDNRAKLFFRMRLRLFKQYVDGDKMTTLKDKFSVGPKELDGVRHMLESMAKDLAQQWPQGFKKNASQQNAAEMSTQQGAAAAQTATPPTHPAPLNAANLEKQTQALNKMHQWSGSRGAQTPAAPTSSRPPVSFGGNPSAGGHPTYAGNPTVTQENLQLPARKRPKTGMPSGPSTNASPNVTKLPSPEMNKRSTAAEAKQAPKPQFLCSDTSCEYHRTGFHSEEAQRKHVEEEHIKPAQDPFKYVQECFADAFGVDPDAGGKVKPSGAPIAAQHSSSPMVSDVSKQGQTPSGRVEATSMSREPSIKKQGHAADHKPQDLVKAMAAKNGTPRVEPTVRGAEGTADADKWATVDPQDLFSNALGLEMGGNGAISDMDTYRAITPNDTPESTSKDSASSEPNSDVSEGVSLNLTLDMGLDTWQPFGGSQWLNMDSADLNMGDSSSLWEGALTERPSWDNMDTDFTKPFTLDTSLFSFDTTT